MAKTQTQKFYDHKPPREFQPLGEMEPITKEPKPEVCWNCGCGNFKLRLQKLYTIKTRKEESYIIRKCRDGCGKDQQPLI